MRHIFVAIAATLLTGGALCGPAQAEWGTGCDVGSSAHCYAESRWDMTGHGEEVLGLVSWITTERMNVLEWYRGAFVTNEEWAAQEPYHLWVETGQEAGWGEGGKDCCSLRWFTAWKNFSGYGQNESPWTVPSGTGNHYLVKFTGGTSWCFEIGSGSAGCVSGLLASSTSVALGMEAASPGEPENWGKAETDVDWLNQTWHPWNRTTYKASRYGGPYTTHVCVGALNPSDVGSVEFGTC